MNYHLGNVLATVLDRKTGEGADASSSLYDHWVADLASTADYYPGGMMMPGRNTEYSWSRMGYNGKLKDDEVYGKGNFQDFGARMYDSRILRFPTNDPDKAKYPFQSPYVYANNTPIQATDEEGKGAGYAVLKFLAQQTKSTVAVGTAMSVSYGVGISGAAGMAG